MISCFKFCWVAWKYIVASDWLVSALCLFKKWVWPIRSNYIYPCYSMEFETRYRALIHRPCKPTDDGLAAAQARLCVKVRVNVITDFSYSSNCIISLSDCKWWSWFTPSNRTHRHKYWSYEVKYESSQPCQAQYPCRYSSQRSQGSATATNIR